MQNLYILTCMSNILTFNDPFIETNVLSEGRGGVVVEGWTPNREVLGFTQDAKSLCLAKNRLEVTSPAIVVLNACLA